MNICQFHKIGIGMHYVGAGMKAKIYETNSLIQINYEVEIL